MLPRFFIFSCKRKIFVFPWKGSSKKDVLIKMYFMCFCGEGEDFEGRSKMIFTPFLACWWSLFIHFLKHLSSDADRLSEAREKRKQSRFKSCKICHISVNACSSTHFRRHSLSPTHIQTSRQTDKHVSLKKSRENSFWRKQTRDENAWKEARREERLLK